MALCWEGIIMETEFRKITENVIEIKEVETKEVVKTYVYNDLLVMRDNLVKEKLNWVEQHDKKIAELDATIAEADRLGIKVKPEEVVKEGIDEGMVISR